MRAINVCKKCLGSGFKLIKNNFQSLKKDALLEWKRLVWQIEESLFFWVEALRRSEEDWAERVDNGKFKRYDGSGQPEATIDREEWVIFRAVTAPDSSLRTIRRANRKRVSTMTILRRSREQNLRSYWPLCYLPLTLALWGAKLLRCLVWPGWNDPD